MTTSCCIFRIIQQHFKNTLDSNIFFKVSESQLWKLEDKMLKNKEGLVQSDDLWNFKTQKDGLIYIENASKTKVLTPTNDNQVDLEDFDKDKAEQLWKKGVPDSEGYFIIESSVMPVSVQVPKVITACSENGLEMKHLKHLNKNQLKNFLLERTVDGATLKRNHKYFYQVQAQMEVTGFSETLFVV